MEPRGKDDGVRLSAPSLAPDLPDEARGKRGSTALVVVGVAVAALVLVVPVVVLLVVTHEHTAVATEDGDDEHPATTPRDDHGAVEDGDRDQHQAFPGLDDDAAEHVRQQLARAQVQAEEQAREARMADLRRRFRPGRHVSLDSLVLGPGRAAPLVLSQVQGGGADTPWSVAGSRWQSMTLPPPTGAPPLELGPGQDDADMLRVLPGEPVRLAVHVASGRGSEVEGLIVYFPGYLGSFYLPLDVQTELGAVHGDEIDDATLYFAIRAPIAPWSRGVSTRPFAADIQIATVDHRHHVGPPLTRKLEVMPTGTGDVEVTLAMTRATDLDLYVVDPSGGVVYYGNRDTPGGGHLDLDANAACSSNMGVDHEHVFWPPNRAPAGTYTVRVANFESCIHEARVDFRVTVRACGDMAVLSGHFTGRGVSETCTSDPGDRPEWCDTIVTFDVPQCGDGHAADPKHD